MGIRTLIRLAAVAAVGASAAVGTAAAQQDFHWSGRLAAGKTIEIKGVNGEIRAAASSGGTVEVSATKQARHSDPAEVKIVVVQQDDGVTICAVYPSDRESEPNECASGERGHLGARDNDTQVNFTVAVPKGVTFVGRTVNGAVAAEALEGDVEAYTVNGGIRASTTGSAEAETVNGSIAVRLGRANWTGTLAFRTVNGSITLDLPTDLDTDVRAETVNGDIETDFPLVVTGRLSSRRLSGTIGKGGRDLSLSTVNGEIRLRKGT